MAPIAPLAAHSATITPTANAIAEADLFWAASFFARSIMLITPWGATEPTKCSSELKAPAPNRQSGPTSRIPAGRKASRALNAPCCESPMQSSARNRSPARLNTSSHSAHVSPNGLRGGVPVRGRFRVSVVAVDKGERADLGLRRPFPPTACKQPHRRADAAGCEEARPERSGRDERQVRAKLAFDVGHLGDAAAEVLDRARELLPLRLDVAADLLRRSPVRSGHRASTPPWSILLPRSPAPATAGAPFGPPTRPRTPAAHAAPTECPTDSQTPST